MNSFVLGFGEAFWFNVSCFMCMLSFRPSLMLKFGLLIGKLGFVFRLVNKWILLFSGCFEGARLII